MSSDPELTPDDVREILRLVDESRFDELELETPRFSIRFTRTEGSRTAVPVTAPSRRTDGLVDVVSPMVGTLYRAPGPGEPPFVEVGDRVEKGAKLCIIEVMKLMNTVAADSSGEIAEVCVGNGVPVQYGEVLFRIRADG